MDDDHQKVERVVKGGATAFPKYDGPMPPNVPGGLTYFLEWIAVCVRGPALAVVATHLVFPRYQAWTKAMLARGYTEERAFAWAATVVHFVVYLGCFGFFETLDRFHLLRRYKLARTPGQEPTWSMKLRTLAEFCVAQGLNFFLLGPLVFGTLVRRGAPSTVSPLPSNWAMFKDFAVATIVNRWAFYWTHRLVHHGPLYRLIHKKHHQYVGTVAIAAENAHPVEAVLSNALPSLGGCLLMGSHPAVFMTWLAWRLEETYEAHSGYCFRGSWLHSIGLTNADHAAYHDHHHVVNKGNFGIDPFCDWVGGTNDYWRANGGTEGYVALAQAQHAKEDAQQHSGDRE